MHRKQILFTALIALGTSVLTYALGQNITAKPAKSYGNAEMPVSYANYAPNSGNDFQLAASKAIPAVVHINTATAGKRVSAPAFDPFDFFGGSRDYYQPPQMGSGSGVIIQSDGYIVTNNHVVNGAEEITVTLSDNSEYIGKVVGTDPSTDIAVVKIEAKNLPTLTWENSDNVNIGQWVLAVGYPLNLDATVTAGIVSAKSRNIGINSRQSNNAVESFIQTDAAVNQGNSGGALVDGSGNLIGINSAIASPTGSYAGYSYAIPSNIARKIVSDIIQYGEARRGYLGIYYEPLSPKVAEENGLASNEQGILINEVISGGAAEKAGLKKGDIIQMVGNSKITSDPKFREKIATLEQGEAVQVTYKRNGKILTTTVVPTASVGMTKNTANPRENPAKIADRAQPSASGDWFAGVDMETLPQNKCKQLGINGGVKLKSAPANSRLGSMIGKDFIITSINGKEIASVKELKDEAAKSDGLELGGVYEDRNGNFYIQIR